MANVLFLAHRLPYPPNKGDKVRSYHMLCHLAARHRVYLGAFIDDPADEQHLQAVRALCAEVHAPRLVPRRARLRSLRGLLRQEPLMLAYYRNKGMADWVCSLQQRELVDCTLVFSSSMAQYARFDGRQPVLVDFVDVDSAKWTDYSLTHRWPLSWVYKREGRTLLAYERTVAARADHSFFSSEREAGLFRSLAPEQAKQVVALRNGVDADYFAPRSDRLSPFQPGEIPLVFTGAMDYWPNIDAVCWFVQEMLAPLKARWPGLRFHIVGRAPTAEVRRLASSAVNVTGTVSDVRPYLQHAAAAVAPVRLARGIQNKVLEAMAMGRPMVTSEACAAAIDARPGEHLMHATNAEDYVRQIDALLAAPERAFALGRAGREHVLRAYGWDASLQRLDDYFVGIPTGSCGT